MSFCVPDYKVERPNENDDNDHHIFDSRRKKPSWHGQREGDDLVELLWQNGQVVMQSQNQRSNKKPYLSKHQQQKDLDAQASSEDLFIQEDEMAAWLHYPIDYESFDTDFLPSTVAPPSTSRISQVSQTPEDRRPTDHEKQQIPPAARKPAVSPSELEKSMQVSRTKARVESTIVDSSETPAGLVAPPQATEEEQGREVVTCDVTVTSSSGGSEEPSAKLSATDNRKRKGREVEDDDCNSEDVGLDSADTKKHAHVSTSVRRSRAAEVHNLSERRRRDRINEKMKALQELIPRCNKSDKASMLDEAIEYLKSLQLQVQMMSMGSCMLPMGFPSVQQYMSPMLMGMGMGMGMDAGLSHPMLPFPSVLAGSSMPAPAAVPTHLGPRLSMPAFHIPPLSSTDLPRTQAASQPDTTINSIRAQNPSLLQVPNFNDPYQHYLGLHHMQLPPCPPRMTVPYQGPVGSENPATAQQNTCKGVDNLEDNKSR